MLLAPLPFVVFADFWVSKSIIARHSQTDIHYWFIYKVADQFNSLAPALKDFHYFICFYTNKHSTLGNGWDLAVDADVCTESWRWLPYVLISIPAYWRWSQCLRRQRSYREETNQNKNCIYSGFEIPGQHGLTLSMLANIHLESSQISLGNSSL